MRIYFLALLSLIFVILGGERHFVFSEDRQLEVWAMGAEGEKIGALAREFEKINPGVRVSVQSVPWGAAHEKLITAVAGESVPDVCQLGSTWVPEFQAMGVLVPLDTFLSSSVVQIPDFFGGSLKINFIGGQLFGIPWYVDTRVLFYRKDILRSVGYDEAPKTWEEFLDLSRLLAIDQNGDGKLDRYAINLPFRDWGVLAMFIWQNGGRILDQSMTHSDLESLEAEEAFEFYVRFFDENLAPRELAAGTDIFNAFEQGFFPMFISGPWMLKELHDQVPKLDGYWDVATLPKKKGFTSFVGGSSLVIFKGTKEASLAWEFIEFMSLPETQVKWYQLTQDLPSNRKAWDDPYFLNLSQVKVFGEQLKDTESSPSLPQWEEIADVINNRMERAVFGKETVHESLKVMSKEINQILARKKVKQSTLFKSIVIGLYFGLILFALGIYFFSRKSKNSFPETSVSIRGRTKRYLKAYGFILPSMIVFMIFLFAPLFLSLLMSFTNWDIYSMLDINQVSFVGLDNYKNLFHDKIFLRSLWNTVVFVAVGGPLTIVAALFLATLLNSAIVKFRTVFRIGFFTPVVTTMVAVAVVWRWLYNARFGIINWLLSLVGLDGKNWLGDPAWAMPALILMAVWKNFGYHMVIFLAGLQGIPPHLYEAARIDGANRVQAFFYITIPLLKPTIFFVAIMVSIGYFQFFAEPYIMTDGGPLDSTISVILYMYRQGFKYFHMGYASSIAYVLFVVIAGFSLIQFRLNKQNVDY